jgi:hypothetical protein
MKYILQYSDGTTGVVLYRAEFDHEEDACKALARDIASEHWQLGPRFTDLVARVIEERTVQRDLHRSELEWEFDHEQA